MYYTQEQIDRANTADLVSFLQSQGEQLTQGRPKPSIPRMSGKPQTTGSTSATAYIKCAINLAQNLDCYWLYPAVQNEEDYGYYLIDELDELELPEEAKKYFMYEEYGRDAAINDGGRFTDQGYIYNNKNTFM